MTTAIDIITDSLQKIGIYAPNETLSDADASLGLAELNNMIDQWRNDSIFLYQLIEIIGNISAQTQSYTVGPNGLISVPRPNRVVVGTGVASVTINSITTLVDSVDFLSWNAIYAPAFLTTNPILDTPATMFYDPQYPYGWLNLAPIPKFNGTLNFNGYYGMNGFDTLTSDFILAPGEEQALEANLAIILNPYFGGSIVTPELLAEAQQSKTVLTLTNRLSRAMSKRNREAPAAGSIPKQ